ncbi:protein FAM234A isoform X1 [Sceloporus undulatus]|uniref:protein FAM234A isoform X1 n=1 Tax=Sceloporus undulatus TaxID=8520 RepID=UPI001C4B14E9|nr:protein FAM234A isoform X1 [Sceloporus undulatus]
MRPWRSPAASLPPRQRQEARPRPFCAAGPGPEGAAMEGTAEARPLRNQEPKAAAEAEAEAGGGSSGGRRSRWRTAAFFASLFLSLAAVFAFSFAVPCPVRPRSERAWSRSYDDAAAFPFLELADADEDGVQDALFAFRAAAVGTGGRNGSRGWKEPCAEAGLRSPCAFLAAHAGTNGSLLWLKPVAQDLQLLDCAWEHGGKPACLLLGKPGPLAALDLETGQTLWQETANFTANSTVLSPLLKVPSIHKEGALDLLVFAEAGEELIGSFYSGTDGTQIGSSVTLQLPNCLGHLMHVTSKGAHYVLFYTGKGLFGYSVKEIYRMAVPLPAHPSTSLKEDPHWEAAIESVTHQISLLSLRGIRSLTKMTRKPGSNILVTGSATLELVDGQHLGSVWVTDIPHILREPVLGAYDPDEVDVILESQVSAKKKMVKIVEGSSGDIEWEVELLHPEAGSPRPATLPTADHRSAFLFWGRYQENTNRTGSPDETLQPQEQHLYLFHPSLPNVLLEMSNCTEPIIAFAGVLFERSRHACYVLLTGPQVSGTSTGHVVLTKRKLKEDVAGGRVVWLSQVAQDTEQNVRERLLRMRYRSLP